MKRIISLFLALLLLCGCTGHYAVNTMFGVCVMFNDSLYICRRAVADSELPTNLESVGSIENFSSALPMSNFHSTSNDFGSELFQAPDETDKLYSYNREKEQHWQFTRCDTGVVLNGWLYIEDDHSLNSLPDGYISVGTVSNRVDTGVPTAELEAMGIDAGTTILSTSESDQFIQARFESGGNLVLSRFISIDIK